MTARLRTHIDLDEVEASPLNCGPTTRRALVDATRALLAVVEHEGLHRYEVDELNEPWAAALAAAQPFLPEATAGGCQDCPQEYDHQYVPREAARAHLDALEAIDDALECAGHVDPAAAPDVQGETPISFDGQCFEAWPDDPEEWCAGCIAHIALAGAA